jgi:peroxiredoxin
MKNHYQSADWIRAVRAILLFVLCAMSLETLALPKVGDMATDFTLKSTEGENLRLSEQRGNVIMLSFWADWCAPCREQLTLLETLVKSVASDRLTVYVVSLDDMRHSQKLQPAFPVLVDQRQSVSRSYDIDNLPLLLVIDPDGKITSIYDARAHVDEADLQDNIIRLLRDTE